jgi:hypothetical protein
MRICEPVFERTPPKIQLGGRLRSGGYDFQGALSIFDSACRDMSVDCGQFATVVGCQPQQVDISDL